MTTKKTKKHDAPRCLTDEDLQDRNIKVHISIKFDLDVLEAAKIQAKKQGLGYQTYLNQILRDLLINRSIVPATTILWEKKLEELRKELNIRNHQLMQFMQRFENAANPQNKTRKSRKKTG